MKRRWNLRGDRTPGTDFGDQVRNRLRKGSQKNNTRRAKMKLLKIQWTRQHSRHPLAESGTFDTKWTHVKFRGDRTPETRELKVWSLKDTRKKCFSWRVRVPLDVPVRVIERRAGGRFDRNVLASIKLREQSRDVEQRPIRPRKFQHSRKISYMCTKKETGRRIAEETYTKGNSLEDSNAINGRSEMYHWHTETIHEAQVKSTRR